MMASQSISSQWVEDSFSQSEAELLEALLQPGDAYYPWNPADPSSQVYFAEMEQGFELEDWSDEEITMRSQALFASMDSCFPSASLKISLVDKFAARMPKAWLEVIANQAQQVISSNLSLADQLVHCVQELLPNWAEEDLLVFARPYAYAMRGETDAINSTLMQSTDWTELSEMEQIRLSIAIARYAIAELHES
jgi:hypothetical protein